ncbi:MAG: DUF3098 domain-containing protein [Bacteroidota bacterium]
MQKKRNIRSNVQSKAVKWEFPLEKKDLIVISVGIAIVLLGYLLMATGITEEPAIPDGKWNNPLATVVAPFLLVIGYCVVIPLGLIKFFSKKKNSPENNQ